MQKLPSGSLLIARGSTQQCSLQSLCLFQSLLLNYLITVLPYWSLYNEALLSNSVLHRLWKTRLVTFPY